MKKIKLYFAIACMSLLISITGRPENESVCHALKIKFTNPCMQICVQGFTFYAFGKSLNKPVSNAGLRQNMGGPVGVIFNLLA
jgi:hypothetical protein